MSESNHWLYHLYRSRKQPLNNDDHTESSYAQALSQEDAHKIEAGYREGVRVGKLTILKLNKYFEILVLI